MSLTIAPNVPSNYSISQHAADKSRSRKSCPGPLHRRERAYAGSRNMKVDRIGALHNSYLFEPGTSACDISRANGFNSEAALDARLPRWVGVGRNSEVH